MRFETAMTSILRDPAPAASADPATEPREAEIAFARTGRPRPRLRPAEPERFGVLPRLPSPCRGPWVALAGLGRESFTGPALY